MYECVSLTRSGCTMKYAFFPLVVLMLFCGAIRAQENPAFGEAFEQSGLPEFNILIDTALHSWLLADSNVYENTYQVCGLAHTNLDGVVDTFPSIGMRLRGNTSRLADKKSFKLHFTTFGGTEEYFGLKKVNLKGSHNDPTIVRERLAYWMFRQLGGPAPRASNVRLSINGSYQGVFVNLEQIGNRFLNERFGNNSGNLYKCGWGANLAQGTDVYDNTVFELETNTQANDRSDLTELIDALHAPTNFQYKPRLDTILNVDGLLKYLAVEALIGHWDGYSYNKNNYYLYHNDSTGLMEFIMYDPDNTFGIDWVDRDWATRNVYDWANHGDDRPLYTKILGIQSYRNAFTYYLNELLQGPFNPDTVFPMIDDWAAMLEPYVATDPLYALDYGFNASNYLNSFSQAYGGHVDYGLKPFIGARWDAAMAQLDTAVLSVPGPKTETNWRIRYTQSGPTIERLGAAVAKVAMRVWDARGRLISTNEFASVEYGQQLRPNAAKGVSFVELRSPEGTQVLKLVSFTD